MYMNEEDKEFLEWLSEMYKDIYTKEEIEEIFYENWAFTNY